MHVYTWIIIPSQWEGLHNVIQEKEVEENNHQGDAKHNGQHLVFC